jgi:ring-1,2-phenylacetyl-CoA epoxidase subunit PaaA
MASTVPLCEELGLEAPAHWDEEKGAYVLDYPFPCQYVAEEKRWLFDEGEITWSDVFDRWKGRGPMNEVYVESIQRSRTQVGGWLNGRAAA